MPFRVSLFTLFFRNSLLARIRDEGYQRLFRDISYVALASADGNVAVSGCIWTAIVGSGGQIRLLSQVSLARQKRPDGL